METTTIHDGKAIVFAIYKNDRLIGYRQDTCGTIGTDVAKIYHYSKNQVEVVLSNISSQLKDKGNHIAKIFEMCGYTTEPVVAEVKAHDEEMFNKMADEIVFEVRVLESPDRPKEFDVKTATYVPTWEYPREEMDRWIQTPEDHVIIEKYMFTEHGLISQN
jgi:hypothetical protein